MVGLLLISHSAQLAAGVRELAQQMAPEVPIVTAGGTDEGEIGTSFELILQGLAEADEGDGVLVLMDLGSAVMTAETALDFLDDEQRERVQLSNAPLVEGAIAAATVAAGGATLDEVAAAANEARQMQKLPDDAGSEPAAPPVDKSREAQVREWQLINPAGLHARPAAQLVRALSGYDAQVTVRNLDRGSGEVSARSLVGVLGLGAQQGHTLRVSAAGPDATAALDMVEGLISSGFGEMDADLPPPAADAPVAPPTPAAEGELRGIAASPGIAIGRAWPLDAQTVEIPTHQAEEIAREQERLAAALEAAKEELETIERQSGEAEAAIFGAHRLLLDDPTLLDEARERIESQKENAAAAWHAVTQAQAGVLAAMDDPLFAGRAADLRDVGQRVLRHLVGGDDAPEIPTGAIVLAEEVAPSQVAALRKARVAGIATTVGGPTSHAAILARSLGIPAVMGLGSALDAIAPHTTLVLDGTHGVLLLEPPAEVIEQYRGEAEQLAARQESARQAAQEPATLADGRRVQVAANAASVEEAAAAVANGAEGIGLLRTEFLFLGRPDLPTEEEQMEALRVIFQEIGERPIIVRTLDAGGDKPIPALALDPITNGFLGVRGLRYCLQQPELFRTQLRAILRAAAGHQVSLMFPMVTTVEEVRAARTALDTAQRSLDEEGTAWAAPQEVGIMVEVPAAALAADQFASVADFFSVGSNDLVQYTMAAERTNQAVASLYQPSHPAILRLLAQLVERAHEHGLWVGVCGEMASDPALIPLLVGLGIDELSMTPPAIPQAKATIRTLTMEEAREQVERALHPKT